MVALDLERRLSKPEGVVGSVNVPRSPAALLSKGDHRDKVFLTHFLSIL